MPTTPKELFRSGNAGSARLDRVRTAGTDPDVDTFIDATGAIWIKGNGRGVATSDAIDRNWRGTPHRLPGGSSYPADLRVWEDSPGHWVWEPVRQMLLTDYQASLSTVNALFVKVSA